MGYNAPRTWTGSLITESRDAIGLYYRRNRFYDAETGQFTQEDPIGIAGGLNVYGFADGDPISYSDPYGLKVRCKNAQACAKFRRVFLQAKSASLSSNPRIAHNGQSLANTMSSDE